MKKESEKQIDSSYIEGAISLNAVYESGSRQVEKVFVHRDKNLRDRKYRRLNANIMKNSTPVEYCDDEFFTLNAIGTTHGGIMAKVGERKMSDIKELLENSKGFIVILEGIEDPYNFGYSIRSLYAAGADSLILTPRNWMSAAGVCIRASAGTSEKINCAVCDDYTELKKTAKELGYTFYCAVEPSEDSIPIYRAEFNKPLILVIGGEKRGISASLMECCDQKITIEYADNGFSDALTTAAASAVIGFEILHKEMRRDDS